MEKEIELKVHKKKKCWSCKKVRACIVIMQSYICLDCYNESHYEENCKVCLRMGRFCKRHKLRSFE